MNIRTILAAATCLVLPAIAHAQPVTGPYVNLSGGIAINNPVNFHFNGSGTNGRFLYRPDYTVMGGIGYGFGDGFRIEFEGSDLTFTAHKRDADTGQQFRIFGTERNYGGFANVIYDAKVGLPIYPFVGAGAGYQFVSYAPHLGNRNFDVYHIEGSFAYDVLAGVAYPVPMVPGLSLTAEYRFMQLTESRHNAVYSPKGPGVVKIGQESSHSFMLGLRYQIFNPPPAPTPIPTPVQAPAPVIAKSYLVFFDWDKYNLTPRALNVIAQAASDSKTTQVTTMDVSGYTDTSGTAAYNMGLSWRRAKAVAAQLVTDGVPGSEIETHGLGETHPLVPTGPGVREPQNRRVEIVFN